MSNILRDYVQSSGGQPDDDEDSELVQVVECVAALSSPELVAEMVVFI